MQGIKMNMKTSLEKNMAGRGTFGDGIRRSAKRLKNKTHIVFYDHNKERSEFTYEEVNEKLYPAGIIIKHYQYEYNLIHLYYYY